jgi:hypothetical protein
MNLKCKRSKCNNFILSGKRTRYCSDYCKKQKLFDNQPTCNASGCNLLVPRGSDGRWRQYCSVECKHSVVLKQQAITRNNTWATKSKKEEILKKYKNTTMKNYGVEHHMQLDSVKQKKIQLNLIKYGTSHHLQSSDIIQKRIDTCIEKYGMRGAPNPKVSNDIAEKLNNKEFLENEHKSKSIKQIAKEIGVKSCWVYRKFSQHGLTCHGQDFVEYSSFENEVKTYLLEHNVIFSANNRTIISPSELDIYIPEKHIAIECNGSFWHSEFNGKNSEYHLTKTLLCEKLGIQLIHIWEHDWNFKNYIVKNILKGYLKIYKNNFHIYEISYISKNEQKYFLNNNHLYGFEESSYAIGIYVDKLVSLMSFNDIGDGNYQLVRFSNDNEFSTHDSFNKLLQFFIKDKNPNSIIVNCDNMIESIKFYESYGFNRISYIQPTCYYTKNYKKFINGKVFENMNIDDKNKYDRIWDSGTTVLKLINSQKGI